MKLESPFYTAGRMCYSLRGEPDKNIHQFTQLLNAKYKTNAGIWKTKWVEDIVLLLGIYGIVEGSYKTHKTARQQ